MFIFNPKKIFFAKLSFFGQITKKSERLNWLSVLLIFFIDKGQVQQVQQWSHQSTNINHLTPMSDQDRISPYNINTISTR